MFTVALFGAGKIGEAICGLLGPSGRYKVKVCDTDLQRTKAVAAMWPNCEGLALDLNDKKSSAAILNGCDAVISALPYFCNPSVATLAHEARVHYFDLTEDVATTDKVAEIAKDSPVCFMPQCSLAPGCISIAAFSLAQIFGAKPQSLEQEM